jgi:hypothetical protein
MAPCCQAPHVSSTRPSGSTNRIQQPTELVEVCTPVFDHVSNPIDARAEMNAARTLPLATTAWRRAPAERFQATAHALGDGLVAADAVGASAGNASATSVAARSSAICA